MAASEEEAPIRIRKYANRRLYNTATSSYVTLADLAQLVRDGVEFTVEDAKSGEDLTRATLTQIIVDEEQSGANLLPVSLLRQIISMYRDNAGWMLPAYLEQSMEWFTANHDAMRREVERAYGAGTAFGSAGRSGQAQPCAVRAGHAALEPLRSCGAGTEGNGVRCRRRIAGHAQRDRPDAGAAGRAGREGRRLTDPASGATGRHRARTCLRAGPRSRAHGCAVPGARLPRGRSRPSSAR